jgi:hypothetical protein
MMVSLIEGGATINDAAFSAATDIFNDSAVALEDTSGLSTVDGAPSKKRIPLLGGEASLLGVEIEEKGVQAILEALADEEKKEMTDTTMPIRHFRAEKVCNFWRRCCSLLLPCLFLSIELLLRYL